MSQSLVPSLVAAVALVTTVHAAPSTMTGRATVIELFTSQGCSSCPPADQLLGELAKRSDVLALAFHVDYWDSLGWKDRFDLPISVQRQSRYAERLGLASVYTPQMVVDGRLDVLGSDSKRLTQVLAVPREGIPVHVTFGGGEIAVSVGTKTSPVAANSVSADGAQADVQLVAYLNEATTAIGRGENSGRLLKEFNVVRSISTLGPWQGAAGEWHVNLKSLPPDATAVAVLVQQSASGEIIGAAHATLPARSL